MTNKTATRIPTSYSIREAAELTGVAEKTLRNWLYIPGRGPVATRLGGKVRYLERDLLLWIESAREDAAS